VPTRTARLTKAGPQPCAAAWCRQLPGLESNQRRPESESGWVPATLPVSVRAERFELSSGRVWAGQVCLFPSRPHGAPPGARTPYPWIKSPVLHPYSSRRPAHLRVSTTARSGMRESNPHSRLGGPAHLAVVLMPHGIYVAPWLPEDSNLAPAGLHPAALPDELENLRLARRIRTSGLVLPKHAPYPSAMASQWTAPDSNRKPTPCGGVALPIGASSPEAARRRAAGSGRSCGRENRSLSAIRPALLVVFRCAVINTLARSPCRWCSHGRQESNLQQLVLETSALPG
jgi:hypothetical protein